MEVAGHVSQLFVLRRDPNGTNNDHEKPAYGKEN